MFALCCCTARRGLGTTHGACTNTCRTGYQGEIACWAIEAGVKPAHTVMECINRNHTVAGAVDSRSPQRALAGCIT